MTLRFEDRNAAGLVTEEYADAAHRDGLVDGARAEAQRHAAFLSWLDAEIEAARQLNRSDPIATRSALERVKARLVR